MLNDYKTLSAIVGNALDAPGKGGNISVKNVETNTTLIKASGEDLKDDDHAISVMKINNNEVISVNIRPSMEYMMHLNIPYKYVVHYHPIYVLPYLCSNYNFDGIGETLEYYTPGEDLGEAIKKVAHSKIIFLKNHGVVISSDDLDEIKYLYDIIHNKFFVENNESYTPDDFVDRKSPELWMFRKIIELTAQVENLKLTRLTDTQTEKLNNSEAEKYRKEKM